jgi:hypothetical protein
MFFPLGTDQEGTSELSKGLMYFIDGYTQVFM